MPGCWPTTSTGGEADLDRPDRPARGSGSPCVDGRRRRWTGSAPDTVIHAVVTGRDEHEVPGDPGTPDLHPDLEPGELGLYDPELGVGMFHVRPGGAPPVGPRPGHMYGTAGRRNRARLPGLAPAPVPPAPTPPAAGAPAPVMPDNLTVHQRGLWDQAVANQAPNSRVLVGEVQSLRLMAKATRNGLGAAPTAGPAAHLANVANLVGPVLAGVGNTTGVVGLNTTLWGRHTGLDLTATTLGAASAKALVDTFRAQGPGGMTDQQLTVVFEYLVWDADRVWQDKAVLEILTDAAGMVPHDQGGPRSMDQALLRVAADRIAEVLGAGNVNEAAVRSYLGEIMRDEFAVATYGDQQGFANQLHYLWSFPTANPNAAHAAVEQTRVVTEIEQVGQARTDTAEVYPVMVAREFDIDAHLLHAGGYQALNPTPSRRDPRVIVRAGDHVKPVLVPGQTPPAAANAAGVTHQQRRPAYQNLVVRAAALQNLYNHVRQQLQLRYPPNPNNPNAGPALDPFLAPQWRHITHGVNVYVRILPAKAAVSAAHRLRPIRR